MKGLGSCIRLDLALMRARALPRVALAATVLAAVLSVLLGGAPADRGHQALASLARVIVGTLAGMMAVLGAVSIAGDVGSGALRAVLVRPVRRTTVVLAHALVLLLTTILLYGTALLLGYVLVKATGEFGDARLAGYTVLTSEDLTNLSWRLLLLPIPGLCCAALLGLLVSAITDDGAGAVMISLFLVEGPFLFRALLPGTLPRWLFSERAMHPADVLRDLSAGVQEEQNRVESLSYLTESILEPAAFGVLIVILALIIFHRREMRA